jgi:nicotinate-nucleotide pyrophosphorylase (carboxylating)
LWRPSHFIPGLLPFILNIMNISQQYIEKTAQLALVEDIGTGDVTCDLIAESSTSSATVITREPAIICGTAWFNEVFNQLDNKLQIIWHVKDGDEVKADQLLCELSGSTRSLLSGERAALNFLQTLSGTASLAHQYAHAIRSTKTKVLDTRKTIPGLRLAQKYAVACGGGVNHRMGLYDAILIKENHIMGAGSIQQAVEAARQHHPDLNIEVEVENMSELQQAMDANVERVLLDNFSLQELQQAVKLNNNQLELEASGNVTLDSILSIAETGVDYISSGAITKDIKALDLSMRFQSTQK